MTEQSSNTEAPKSYTHGEITIDHNSDRVRIEGPSIKLDLKAPKSMRELQGLVYEIINITKSVTYISLVEENEDNRKIVDEW